MECIKIQYNYDTWLYKIKENNFVTGKSFGFNIIFTVDEDMINKEKQVF